MDALPRLRPLELLQIPNEGMLLRDPEGFSEEELVLSEPAVFIAAHFDGEHTLEDAQKAFGERYGRMPTESEVQALWDQLSEAFFLENDAFVARKKSRIESFLGTAERAPAHEGVAYPKDPEEAKKTVTRFFEEATSLEQSGEIPSGSLAGLVAPHIDLRHGGPCTALAYRYLAEATHINTVVVLGTSHACPEPAWIVSDKPFQTPLGTVPIDEEAVNYLRSSAPSTKEQLYLHRHEHSIEFQALFLAALRSLGRSISMVPVLCGSVRDGLPEQPPAFLSALHELLIEREGKTLVIAAADLAHVGPRFGDPEALEPKHLQMLEKKDRQTLELVSEGDPSGFYNAVMDSGDPRRICGLAPIFAMLQVIPGAKGKLLRYEQANDETGTVSYASLGLWR